MKPYSAACEQNKQPILTAIQPLLQQASAVLEVGSGTGQHAVYFAQQLPHLMWHTSDVPVYHRGIQQWLDEADLSNLSPPLTLDVAHDRWPDLVVDAVFSANTVHIMHWPEVEAFFAGVGGLLKTGGLFILYGPFNYNGTYTSESNARFDDWLKQRDPQSGIRDHGALNQLAEQAGLRLQQDIAMPANNRILVWQAI